MVFGGNMSHGHQHSPLPLKGHRARHGPLLVFIHSKIPCHGAVLPTFETAPQRHIQRFKSLMHRSIFWKADRKHRKTCAGNSSFLRHGPACEVQPFIWPVDHFLGAWLTGRKKLIFHAAGSLCSSAEHRVHLGESGARVEQLSYLCRK